jgi:hypothetical protein
MNPRYFYHSFPRRKGASLQHGLSVLDSILRSGLLLTPEVVRWRRPGAPITEAPVVDALQIRICFTELSPDELSDHSKTFGPFALEFTIQDLRELGGIPVFYVPYNSESVQGFNSIGQLLVMRISEIQQFLARARTIKQANDGEWANAGYKEAVGRLSHGLPSLEELDFTITALQGLFYPTENLSYTDELAYYRQREWRILENFAINGQWPFRTLTENEITTLKAMDSFFDKTIDHPPTGGGRVIDRCRFFTELLNKPVLDRLRRIVAPGECLAEAKRLVASVDRDVEVVALESLASSPP